MDFDAEKDILDFGDIMEKCQTLELEDIHAGAAGWEGIKSFWDENPQSIGEILEQIKEDKCPKYLFGWLLAMPENVIAGCRSESQGDEGVACSGIIMENEAFVSRI